MTNLKIIGLLNLNELFIFKDSVANFENAVNSAYKLSEDGANGIIVFGKSFFERNKICSYLKPRLDIPVSPLVNSENQLKLIENDNFLFSVKHFGIKKIIRLLEPKTKSMLLKSNNEFSGILLTNKRALKIFKMEADYLDEVIAVLACRATYFGLKYFATENVLSARKGAELCKKLF